MICLCNVLRFYLKKYLISYLLVKLQKNELEQPKDQQQLQKMNYTNPLQFLAFS